MSTASTIHREIAEAWNGRDFARMRELLHAEYTYSGVDGKPAEGGPDAGIEVAKMYARAFPDGTLEVLRVYTNRNIAVAEMVARGTHGGDLMGIPATGRPVEVPICNVIELREGKAYREREYFDMLGMLAQVGAANAPGRTATA